MPLGSLEDILSQVASFQAGAQQAEQKLSEIYNNIQGSAAQMAVENTNTANDERVVTAAEQAGKLQTAARIQRTADIFNSDVLKDGNAIQELASRSKAAFDQKMELAQVIADKQSVGLFDDPLEYISNRFTLNTDIAAHNAANSTWQTLQARINEINQNTQATVQTQKQLETGVTEASALAAARVAGAKARIAAIQSDMLGQKYGAEGINAVLNARKDQLQASQTAFSSRNAEEQIQMSRRQLELAEENARERKREFDEKMDLKRDEAAMGQFMVDSINRGRAARGLPPLDDLNGKMAQRALMGKGGIVKDEWQADYNAGQRIEGGVVGSIAKSPVELLTRIKTGTPLNLTPQQKPLLDLAENAIKIVQSAATPGSDASKLYPQYATLDPKKDPEKYTSAINEVSQQLLLQQSKRVNPENRDNIFNIPNIKVLAANSPAIQETAVYQKVLKPLVDQGVDLTNPKLVFNLVGDAVANGTISHKQALETTTIYHVGVAVNAAQRNTMGVAGLVMPMQYNAEIEITPNWDVPKKAVINLANPQEFSRAILQSQAHRLSGILTPGLDTDVINGRVPTIKSINIPDISLSAGPKNTFLTKDRMESAESKFRK